MTSKLRLLTGATLVLALGMTPACGDDGSADGSGGESSSGGMNESTGPGATSMNTTMQADSGDSGDSGTTATTIDPTTGSECPMEGELGSSCMDPCDCMSGACFEVGPLGGVCSECDEDADCADTTGFGCNFGNPLNGTPAVCGMGTQGESCETEAACDNLYCTTLIEVAGIITANTCSECSTDADCEGAMAGGPLCVPSYDLANIGGSYSCVMPNSIPDDEGCNLTGDGSECMSGNCAPADLLGMGIPIIGVCSPCNEDSDCVGGQTCTLPEIALNGEMLELVPGACM